MYQGMNESHCEGVRVHNTEDSYLTAEAKKDKASRELNENEHRNTKKEIETV